MYPKLSLFVSLYLIATITLYGQTFVSPQQEITLGGFADRLEVTSTKTVEIKGDTFTIDLPDGGSLSGTLDHLHDIQLEEEKRTLYALSSGGKLTIIDAVDDTMDHVFVNLLGTPYNQTITYWLVVADRGDD